MTTMQELDKSARAAIIYKVVTTVERKHYDPKFDCERWRSAIEAQRVVLMENTVGEFQTSLDELVRTFGTPDSGFVHESTRKKVPKGLAARFQYCQPNECAPAYTQPTDAGDVLFSRLADEIGWLKVTKFPGAVGVDIAK